ncbi:hypothetical protein Leryth_005564, partial [Lithospermum erythrorhizon]
LFSLFSLNSPKIHKKKNGPFSFSKFPLFFSSIFAIVFPSSFFQVFSYYPLNNCY